MLNASLNPTKLKLKKFVFQSLICLFLLSQSSIESKIETIAKEIYGADGIELEPLAKEQIERYNKQVCDEMPKVLFL